ncbi:MAG: CPBP family intramembrane metalloprotease [Anaerolineales bacterium]|jgi:membrane protease YdiL (CAAX protease family)
MFKQLSLFQWKPNRDLIAVAISWLLVTAALYTATVIVGPEIGGGMPYFLLYAVLTATVLGVGIPVYWMVFVRSRPIADLGFTTRWLGLSLVLQLILAAIQAYSLRNQLSLPGYQQLIPLIALSLAIGFFEAIFWRGWVLLRLEETFGLIPAVLIGSLMYALYHIGYAMPLSEIVFLFFIGVMFAIVFRLTKNIFILWPLFQPMGQMVTLVNDQLTLPLISTLGFVDVLLVMIVIVWLAYRYHQKHETIDLKIDAQQVSP